jgi:hypothetical protein
MHATGGLISVEGVPSFFPENFFVFARFSWRCPNWPGYTRGPYLGGIHSTFGGFLPDTDLSGIHFF